MIDTGTLTAALSLLERLGLLTAAEGTSIRNVVTPQFPLRPALDHAASIHVHLRVDDVAALPHTALLAAGGTVANQADGYVKYAFPGGTNVILSAIDVAEDDRLPVRAPRPHLDHVGIDLREITAASREIFDDAPMLAARLGWRHVAQGSPGNVVRCCHTSVAEKHWLFPNPGDAFVRPIELALGPLEIHGSELGGDLRPLDPAHPSAAKVACCAAPAPTVSVSGLVRKQA